MSVSAVGSVDVSFHRSTASRSSLWALDDRPDSSARRPAVRVDLGCPGSVAREPAMIGDHLLELVEAVTGVTREPFGGERVEMLSIAEEHRLVGHVAQEGVLEDVLLGRRERPTGRAR